MAVSNIASAWRTRSLLFDGDGAVCGSSRLSPSSIRCEPTRWSLSRLEIEFIMLVMFLVDEMLGCIFVSLDSLLMMNTTTKHINVYSTASRLPLLCLRVLLESLLPKDISHFRLSTFSHIITFSILSQQLLA